MGYEYRVNDADGLWGSMRVEADSEEVAVDAIRVALERELVPNGSLLPGYTLDRIT